jgi:hypothetical protein
MMMPGRKYSAQSGYRYGFNGMEKSNEIKGDNNSYEAKDWEYDPRISRRWNVDPILKEFESPYLSFSGNPIIFADPLGDDAKDWIKKADSKGNVHYTWDANVTGEDKTPAGYTYVGKSGSYYAWEGHQVNLWEGGNWSGGSGETFSSGDAATVPPVQDKCMANPGCGAANSEPIKMVQATMSSPDPLGGYTDFERGMITSPATHASIGLMVPGYNFGMRAAATFNGLRSGDKIETGLGVVTMLMDAPNLPKSSGSPGTDLTVRAKSTWTEAQVAEAQAKANALTKAKTVVTKNPVAREANLRSKFVKAGGILNSGQHVDHIVDLQLGGTNAVSNLQALDGSVNTSFGKQLELQIRNLPDATRINRVILLPPKKL